MEVNMIIEKYSDIEKIEDNMIVDLSKLEPKIAIRVIEFLNGLTFKNGSLKKLESGKYLVKM